MGTNSFGAKGMLKVGKENYEVFRIGSVKNYERLPYSLKILLENLLRAENGSDVTAQHIHALSSWDPAAQSDAEIQFTPARVIMQDFTGVPCVVDLATMREAVAALGGDPNTINPISPAELVIDHSVQIDLFGNSGAFNRNMEMEYRRNAERYRFLRWGQSAFNEFKVVPPGTGIVHQVNIEYLAHVIMPRTFTTPDGSRILRAYPDTCVGTDSHTTMVNGLGVLGWGVGGIEAEAAMLGQPISMLIPKVVGFKLIGSIGAGVTATDVVLTITQMLRRHGAVGKFVEFYGEGVVQVPLANRATIGNMSPEFGSTVAIFPVDQVTLDYLRLTGRSEQQIALTEAYSKEQGLWHDPDCEVRYSEYMELDLSTVVPSIAGPRRPQDRINLDEAKERFCEDLENYAKVREPLKVTALVEAQDESFPASDSLAISPHSADEIVGQNENPTAAARWGLISNPTTITMPDGSTFTVDHGAVVIASITSCTNTSNPSVMVTAALLARNAVAKGLTSKPWVKTSLAPGSKVVTDYYNKSGLTPYLEKLGFYLVGYGCTTCIGNSGPIIPEISAAVNDNDLSVVAVLSGNRNFEGRINPDVKMNYLASPPLVIAYAIAGSMNFDFTTDALGKDQAGDPVFLRDIWPTAAEVDEVIGQSIDREMFALDYAEVFDGDERWRSLPAVRNETFQWDPASTYVRKPPYFDDMEREPASVKDIEEARVLVFLGDSVTTDHISPAGSFTSDTPAGRYLIDHGVERKDFNSYGSRRGNHEVMIRGTFANIRLRNKLLDGVEGGFTRDFTRPEGPRTTVYEASQHYRKEKTPLVILAGKEYGSGSSRDWAAKGTSLLGVKAVIAESFERIHRSNLIGMGVIPLEFPSARTAGSLRLTGEEIFSIKGLTAFNDGLTPKTVRVSARNPKTDALITFDAVVRIDTPGEAAYYLNGGILHYVLRSIMRRPAKG